MKRAEVTVFLHTLWVAGFGIKFADHAEFVGAKLVLTLALTCFLSPGERTCLAASWWFGCRWNQSRPNAFFSEAAGNVLPPRQVLATGGTEEENIQVARLGQISAARAQDGRNRVAVDKIHGMRSQGSAMPRLPPIAQPWALGRNPVGILRRDATFDFLGASASSPRSRGTSYLGLLTYQPSTATRLRHG